MKWVLRFWLWRRDSHPFPHMVTVGGGCACLCSRCVRVAGSHQYCVCLRCNEDCTSFGRLGSIDAVAQEQAAGYPRGRQVASRWFRR